MNRHLQLMHTLHLLVYMQIHKQQRQFLNQLNKIKIKCALTQTHTLTLNNSKNNKDKKLNNI